MNKYFLLMAAIVAVLSACRDDNKAPEGGVGDAGNMPSLVVPEVSVGKGKGGGMEEEKGHAIKANAALNDAGQLSVQAGDILLELVAPECRELTDTVSLCNKQVALSVVGGAGAWRQELQPEAVYVNKEATLYRGPLDKAYKNPGDTFIVTDVTGSGHEDLLIWSGKEAAYGGASYDVYLFDKNTNKFEFSEEFSELTVGNNGLFTIDNRQIKTASTDGCCIHVFDTYEVAGGVPKLIERVTEDSSESDGPLKVKIQRLINGEMKEVME